MRTATERLILSRLPSACRMSRGRQPTLLVYRVICSDEDAMHWPEEDIGNLRVALNALVRVFRM